MSERERQYALHLAESLDDVKSLQTYQKFAQRYSESFLEEILDIVIKTKKENIRRSRGAYFTYLVNMRVNSQKNYDRH